MNFDLEELKMKMFDHASIKKAIRVHEKRYTHNNFSPVVAEQYCEFMCLKILEGDFAAAAAKLSPGVKIDSFWHIHLLDTAGYREFFRDVFPPLGPIVHHDAEKSYDDDKEIEKREKKTKEVYQSVFKKKCPFFIGLPLSGNNRISDAIVPAPKVVVIRNPFTVFVRTLTGAVLKLDIGAENTILDLQCLIRMKEGIPEEKQRIIFNGHQLEIERNLADYGISNKSTIQVVLRMCGC
ncbi:hypothetical protein HJC23_011857 [Cyclotella cryptica]|uniref:Ubiquitin-like domain-containing protein n=1 Tax=Cyclotella cryptica TaxID=29204 RepID=A0ABD3QF79_9STRA|eukprot:CCRYP_006166-RA/>CCRYP_006166-RA protein AED:0.44 eAED:0.44 QI:221/1/1/1/0.66/0.75/4/174/236